MRMRKIKSDWPTSNTNTVLMSKVQFRFLVQTSGPGFYNIKYF